MRTRLAGSYRAPMVPTGASVPVDADHEMLSPALVVVAALWFATAIASRSFVDWQVRYALFSVLLLVAAATSAGAIIWYTSTPSSRSLGRVGAVGLVMLAVASTFVAWAFVVWAVLLAAGFASLAATGPRQRRGAGWLSVALLGGLAVAVIGLWAQLGPPGEYNDYSEAQDWGATVACVSVSAVLGMLARRNQRERSVTGPERPS